MTTYQALTIAGSDSGGGAGIQADLKTFQELEVYGMSAITAVTAQNTRGVHGVYPISVEGVVKQVEAIGNDLGTHALKTGMLFSSEIIEAVAEQIERFEWKKVIVDPVMIAKGGAPLLREEAIQSLKERLIPLSLVITPNIPEAEVLSGMKIQSYEDRKKAAEQLHQSGAPFVLIKGGHEDHQSEVTDLLYDGNQFTTFKSQRIETANTHGTGCTFAAALTAEVAKGNDVHTAVEVAKEFIQAAIEEDLEIGNGHGPTNHWAYQRLNKRGE